MSENISLRNEARPEDLPPLFPVNKIVEDIAEKSDEEIATLHAQYATFLTLESMPHAKEAAEKIMWMITFEMEYRKNPDFASEVSELENVLAR